MFSSLLLQLLGLWTIDSEYMLWTDASSREFIAEHYSWFLHAFDDYTYPIQRADAIRYFVLHYYGGIYLDLDIGCLRPLDPLLIYPVILPKTIPVGVSNDLMFAEKDHPFLLQTIHNLVTFDHSWVLNYPTVMFSTGPMFLSAQYGLYTASHPESINDEVRILPKSMYGKNAKEGEAPHSFFSHFYGSSWHADDAALIWFLGTWGKGLMWVGLAVLVIGLGRLVLTSSNKRNYNFGRIGGYEVLLPRWTQSNGRRHLDLGWFTLSSTASQPPSPVVGDPDSPLDEDVSFIPFDSRPISPSPSDISTSTLADVTYSHVVGRSSHPLFEAVRRARSRAVASILGSRDSSDEVRRSRRYRGGRGVLFFLPAIFTQPQDIELSESHRSPPSNVSRRQPFQRSVSRASQLPREKQRYARDLERAGLLDQLSMDLRNSEGASGARSRQPETLVDIEPHSAMSLSPS
jgi:hypothetical protein